MAKKDNKVIKMKPRFQLNVGFLVFFIILIYMFYFVIRFFLAPHVTAYKVEEGSMASNKSYTGIALREEMIESADASGRVNYYLQEGKSAGVQTLVYTLDQDGSLSDILKASDQADYLTDSNLQELHQAFTDFSIAYSDSSFSSVYQLTEKTNSNLADYMNQSALEELQSSSASSGVKLVYAKRPGVIEYYIDGMESLTADEVTDALMDSASYSPTVLENDAEVESGDAVYKMIRNENWQVVIEVTDSVASQLEEKGAVEVVFHKDNHSAWATVTIRRDGKQNFAVLSFTNSMVRYAQDRYLTVKLKMNQEDGLKIPNTAITEKDFYLIPKAYATNGGDSSATGFNKVNSDGGVSFISPTISAENDDYYYVTGDDITEGTILQKADSTEQYTVSHTGRLQGVYCINKGYTVFKQIEILYSGDTYSLVATGSDDGLKQFDYIALDASNVKENQIVR